MRFMDVRCVITRSCMTIRPSSTVMVFEVLVGFLREDHARSTRPGSRAQKILKEWHNSSPLQVSQIIWMTSLNDLRTWAHRSILNRGHVMSFPCRQILLAPAQSRHLGEGMRTFRQFYPSECVLRCRVSIAASDSRFNKRERERFTTCSTFSSWPCDTLRLYIYIYIHILVHM